MVSKFLKFLTESKKRSRRLGEKYVLNNIPLIVKDSFVIDISVETVFDRVSKLVPTKFFSFIDAIYVGDFDIMREREINAMYKDGTIYVSNYQSDEEDMVDDIIHEIAHAVEDNFMMQIYGDNQIEVEFLSKRMTLKKRLELEGFDLRGLNFLNPELDRQFDEFLHKEVGYAILTSLTNDLFYSPYGATSLREYFANGFECYFHKRDHQFLQKVSPAIYFKLENLMEL
jgi:hypothetical protein